MFISVKKSGFAAPMYDADSGVTAGGAPTGDAGGSTAPAPNTTSSIIPGDNYASGGPEPPENEPAERVDFEGFDFNGEPEEEEPDEGEPGEGGTTPESEPETPPEVQAQSPEANAAFAEMRRAKEQAEKDLAARDKWVADNFGQSHGLHSWEQYQKAIENSRQQEDAARQQQMQDEPQRVAQETYKRLIDAGFDEAVAVEMANAQGFAVAQSLQNQALQARLDAVENHGKQQEQIAAQKQQEAMIQQIVQGWEGELKQLKEEFGDLVPASLKEMDKPVIEKLEKGYSLYDAWFMTNRAKVMEQTQKAAAQKTLNNLDSKKHLKTEGDGAGDSSASSIPLSGDTLAMYMDSGMTEKQAKAFHKKLYG